MSDQKRANSEVKRSNVVKKITNDEKKRRNVGILKEKEVGTALAFTIGIKKSLWQKKGEQHEIWCFKG